MRTFKIQNNDIVFNEQKDISMIEDRDEIAQSVERVLTTNKGEWFLNLNLGLTYEAIIGKGKNLESIKLEIIEAIFQDERITDVDIIKIYLNNDRHLRVDGNITTIDDVVIEFEEVLQLG